MNNFRKASNRQPRQAVDGILNAPARPQLSGRPAGRRQISADTFRTNTGRSMDNFRRSEGYHAASQPIADRPSRRPAAAQSAQSSAQDRQSLLHMSLPEGRILGKKRGHKGKDKPVSRRRRILKRVLIGSAAVACLAALLVGFLFAKGYLKLQKVFKGGGSAIALQENVDPTVLKGEGDGRINILLLGRGGVGHDGPDLTDTILLASIDPIAKKASLVSIPRDLYVTVNGYGSMKINSVLANAKYKALSTNPKDKPAAEKAGVAKLQQVVSGVLGVPIHYYTVVDFLAFKQAVDTVGGIDINVTEETAVTERLWDNIDNRQYYLNVQPGQQHFDGTRALYYSRSRHTSPRGDFDRTQRQRLVIQALSQKVLSAGTYTNPAKISGLMSAFGDHVSTDFSINDALRLMTLAKGIDLGAMDSVGLADPPHQLVRTGNIGGLSVVLPVAGQGDYSAIQAYIRTKLRDGYLAKENAIVDVLNGTGVAGVATKKSEELKAYGYNVGKVADAPTADYTKTIIVDLTNGKMPYTKNYLEKRFGVKVTSKVPDTAIATANANFVVILGQQ